MSCKISIIGAGSAVFTLGVITKVCKSKYLEGSTISLMDINPNRLESAYKVAMRCVAEYDADVKIIKTTDRRESLKDANYVINTTLVIGMEKFKDGIEVCLNNGYKFGGSIHIMNGEAFYINFYQIKLMEDILKDILEICPEAYYIVASNPVQAGVTYLTRKYADAKVIGVCAGFTHLFEMTDVLGLNREDIEYDIAGVNHFIWLTKFQYKGKDAYPILDKWIENDFEEYAKTVDYSYLTGPKFMDVYKRFGLYPVGDTANPGGGAWSWIYHVDDATNKKYNERVHDWWKRHFMNCENQIKYIQQIIADKNMKTTSDTLPVTNDPIVDIIESIEADLGKITVVNVSNDRGYMKGLPLDYEVEIKAVIDKEGVHPIPNNGLPKPIEAMMLRDRIAPVEMELAAFETHEKKYLLELIMMDPWTRSRPQAEKLLDDILALPWNVEMKEYYK